MKQPPLSCPQHRTGQPQPLHKPLHFPRRELSGGNHCLASPHAIKVGDFHTSAVFSLSLLNFSRLSTITETSKVRGWKVTSKSQEVNHISFHNRRGGAGARSLAGVACDGPHRCHKASGPNSPKLFELTVPLLSTQGAQIWIFFVLLLLLQVLPSPIRAILLFVENPSALHKL